MSALHWLSISNHLDADMNIEDSNIKRFRCDENNDHEPHALTDEYTS